MSASASKLSRAWPTSFISPSHKALRALGRFNWMKPTLLFSPRFSTRMYSYWPPASERSNTSGKRTKWEEGKLFKNVLLPWRARDKIFQRVHCLSLFCLLINQENWSLSYRWWGHQSGPRQTDLWQGQWYDKVKSWLIIREKVQHTASTLTRGFDTSVSGWRKQDWQSSTSTEREWPLRENLSINGSLFLTLNSSCIL